MKFPSPPHSPSQHAAINSPHHWTAQRRKGGEGEADITSPATDGLKTGGDERWCGFCYLWCGELYCGEVHLPVAPDLTHVYFRYKSNSGQLDRVIHTAVHLEWNKRKAPRRIRIMVVLVVSKHSLIPATFQNTKRKQYKGERRDSEETQEHGH